MTEVSGHVRQTPRVNLRVPRRGVFDGGELLVLEMGLGGAKLEHSDRLAVGRSGVFVCGPMTTEATVRHSVLLPAERGVVYHSGVQFTALGEREHALLLELLVLEARAQADEWEKNAQGERPAATTRPGRPARRSAVALRFVSLRYSGGEWTRVVSADPNQPPDGVTVNSTTSEDELSVLQQSYVAADAEGRELVRSIAALTILEQMTPDGQTEA